VSELIGLENLCTDLEFAVARGLDLVRERTQPPKIEPAIAC